MYALENYLAVAKVWKVLFETYPGPDRMLSVALVGDDERRSSAPLSNPGLSRTPGVASNIPSSTSPLEEVQDDDPPGPMDTSLLDEEFTTPSSHAPRNTSIPPDEDPFLGGLGGGVSDVSMGSEEDSNAGIRVEGSTPNFGWESYATQGARVPVDGGESVAVSDAT